MDYFEPSENYPGPRPESESRPRPSFRYFVNPDNGTHVGDKSQWWKLVLPQRGFQMDYRGLGVATFVQIILLLASSWQVFQWNEFTRESHLVTSSVLEPGGADRSLARYWHEGQAYDFTSDGRTRIRVPDKKGERFLVVLRDGEPWTPLSPEVLGFRHHCPIFLCALLCCSATSLLWFLCYYKERDNRRLLANGRLVDAEVVEVKILEDRRGTKSQRLTVRLCDEPRKLLSQVDKRWARDPVVGSGSRVLYLNDELYAVL